MKRLLWRGGLGVLVILLAAITLAVSATDAVNNRQHRNEVAKMTTQLKTVCAGRFMIDLPQDAQISLSHSSVDGFDIVTYPDESDQDFLARISKRERELASEKNQFGQKSIESSQDIRGDDRTGKIFVFNRISTHLYHGEQKIMLNGVSVNAFLRTGGVSYSFVAKAYDPKQIGNLPRLIAKLRPLAQNQRPLTPGFCIDRGLIADPLTAAQGERVVLFAGLPNHPDLSIVFSSMAGTRPGAGLLQRNAENKAKRFVFLGGLFTTLKEGVRPVNGLPGEELAVRVREINFATTYGFNWEMGGAENDVLKPFVSLELSTGINPQAGGPPVQSTLSESALKELWESMVSSIRIRPVAAPKVTPSGPLTLALGSLVIAGESCPETGWWKCNEGGNGTGVLGGQLQHLKKGQRMPQALLLPPQTLWQKLRGLQPSYENKAPTNWTLMDKRLRIRAAPGVPLAQATPVERGDASRPAAAADKPVPVGTYARTGDPCPADGWWRCEDSHAQDGTRWFAQGSLLPVATFRVSAGVFGKSRAQPELIRRRSIWQLARPAGDPAAVSAPNEIQGAAQAAAPVAPLRAGAGVKAEGARET
jgi:hypothetical protein